MNYIVIYMGLIDELLYTRALSGKVSTRFWLNKCLFSTFVPCNASDIKDVRHTLHCMR